MCYAKILEIKKQPAYVSLFTEIEKLSKVDRTFIRTPGLVVLNLGILGWTLS